MMGFAQLAQPPILITVVRNCKCSDSGRSRRVAKFVTSTSDGQQWWPKGGRHSCRRGTGTPRLVSNSHFFRGQQHRYMTTPYNNNAHTHTHALTDTHTRGKTSLSETSTCLLPPAKHTLTQQRHTHGNPSSPPPLARQVMWTCCARLVSSHDSSLADSGTLVTSKTPEPVTTRSIARMILLPMSLE